ncbi:TerD family protein [Leptolyngbya cf. ectocarpi LEGE 11479]|uniref:TerD family protein n=1 Tax=Leptolyngbya cf. ectocarpi LEGE 11479 TaxID=1828722 RepID=A0A929F7Z9_LEPEC|nr:TerD family protein [Leptolyngbya ectocarpi]MBE9069005.1 TerD family protein [Leptolyngbya cf. ectocarpi LEGE 11479]
MNPDSVVQHLPNSVSQLQCGLGWDAQSETELDLDMAVLALSASGRLASGKEGFIYAGHPRHPSGAIQLLNDSITGEGEGDDEQLLISLLKLPTDIKKLVFVVNIDCGEAQQQDLSQVQNAFWRISASSSRQTLLHHSLSNPQWQGITTLFVATLERVENQWQLIPSLEPSPLKNLNELLHQYL